MLKKLVSVCFLLMALLFVSAPSVAAPGAASAPPAPQATAVQPKDLELPDASLFKPVIPDTSEGSLMGNALKLGRVVLGAAGLGCLIYAAYRFLVLGAEALSGKKSLATIALELAVYGIAVVIILGVFGAAIYALIKDLFAFLHTVTK